MCLIPAAMGCSDEGSGGGGAGAGGVGAGVAVPVDDEQAGSGTGGADSGGDSSNGSSSGGSSNQDAPWLDVVTPSPTEAEQALSCDFIEADNCWKSMIDEALACSPAEVGTLAEDGLSCDFPDGSRVVFSFPATTAPGLQFPEHTLFDAEGDECYSVKGGEIGDYSVRSAAQTVAYDSLSALSYQVICEDGAVYSSAVDGACESTALAFLDGSSPQYILSGREAEGQQELVSLVGGSSASERVIGWTCR